jgi:hypothetical protein
MESGNKFRCEAAAFENNAAGGLQAEVVRVTYLER